MYKLIILTKEGKIYRIYNDLNQKAGEELFYKYKDLGFFPQLHAFGFYNW